MSVIEKVKPVVIDDIEFYISNDGTKSGMSISGLAAFTTVDRRVIGRLIDKINTSEPGLPDVPECLQPFTGKGLHMGIEGFRNAKIIPDKVCEAVIFYYAYESANVTDDVKQASRLSHRKFAQYGLHQFIKTASGYIEQSNDTALVSELRLVIGELKQLQDFAKEYKVIRETTTTYLPGCNDLLDELTHNVDNNLLEPTESGAISIEGWLALNGIILTPTKFRQLAHIAAATYKSLVKQDPEKTHFKDSEGKKKYNVYVYKPEHYPILQIAFNTVFENK